MPNLLMAQSGGMPLASFPDNENHSVLASGKRDFEEAGSLDERTRDFFCVWT